MKKAMVIGAALCLVFASSYARAQEALPAVEKAAAEAAKYFKYEGTGPDITGIPYVQSLARFGTTFRYMGERSGLFGFLIVKGGQIQIMYVTPDRKSVLIGALFADDGKLVTPMQITALSEKDAEVAAIMRGSAQQNTDILRAGVQQGGMAELFGVPTQESAKNSDVPLMPASPGERLVMDLKASSNVVLGTNPDASELLMVVAPNCGYCKEVWLELREAVEAGKLRIRLIPIGLDIKGKEMSLAANLLRAKDPMKTWDSFVQGNKSVLEGEPDQAAFRAIVANRMMSDRWNILATPYLVYRDKKDTVKIVQGKPDRMAAVLADLTQ